MEPEVRTACGTRERLDRHGLTAPWASKDLHGPTVVVIAKATAGRAHGARDERRLDRYHPVMLGGQPLMAFIPVSDLPTATSFYADVLGLAVTEETPYAVVLDAGGTMLRLTQVEDLRPQPFTIAGWQVEDLEASIAALGARGVSFLRYEGMEQSANGIWSTPGGDMVAWFADPDGNTLSLTRFAG